MPINHEDNDNVTPTDNGSIKPRRLVGGARFWAITLSLLFHLALVLVVPLLFLDDAQQSRKEALQVWLTEKPKQKQSDEDMTDKRTVVQVFPVPVKNNQRPAEARYLADVDQSTKEEMRKKTGRRAAAQKAAPVDEKHEQKPRESKQAHELAMRKASKDDPLGLRPQLREPRAEQGIASSDDGNELLAEVKEGDHTELNAWQWRHAPFFNRIKERIGQTWSPQSSIKRFDPQGTMLGAKDRVTVLQVTLDRSGNLRDLKITDESGVHYLDDEAQRAFRAAAPFLYPPQELFSADDEFSFSFAFHLYLNRGVSFGFDWNKD